MSNDENVVGHDMVHENNTQSSTDLLLQILPEMQLKLDNMEKKNEWAIFSNDPSKKNKNM